MERIPDTFLENLRLRVDLVALISQKVKLKKTGSNYAGCCPFHQEKTPSFTVTPQKGFYHCFGCGAHGDAISFIEHTEGLNFIEAVEKLADHLGMPLPSRGSAPKTALKPLYRALAVSTAFYSETLRAHPDVKAYLTKRGISEATMAQFQLGYAPDAWHALEQAVGNTSKKKPVLIECGLIIEKEGRTYDRFRNRIMFPILDARKRVLGFGARVLDDSLPKYLNSPETPVFQKGSDFYGIHLLTSDIESLIVVEGYFDVITLTQAGIKGALATLGTALTEGHVQKLFRLRQKLIFCFDGDTAGVKAMDRALLTLLPHLQDGCSVHFALLPKGHDPDSLVRKAGVEAFQTVLNAAKPLSDFLFELASKECPGDTIDARSGYAKVVEGWLNKMPRGTFQTLMRQALRDKVGLGNRNEGRPFRPVWEPRRSSQNLPKSLPPHPAEWLLAIFKVYPDKKACLPNFPAALLAEPQVVQFLKTLDQIGTGAAEAALSPNEATWVGLIPKDGLEAEIAALAARFVRLLQKAHYEKLIQAARQRALTAVEKLALKQLMGELNLSGGQ